MAQGTPTWSNPLPAGLGDQLSRIFQSLTSFFSNNPVFPQGITVGNGTPATFSTTSGAQTAAAPVALGVDTAGNIKVNTSGSGTALLNGRSMVGSINNTGLIVQSGQSTSVVFTAGSGGTLTFPTAFPTQCLVCIAMLAASPPSAAWVTRSAGPTASGCPLALWTGSATGVGGTWAIDWIAVGY